MTAPITNADKLACLRRELRMRERVYPDRVAAGRMTAAQADRECAIVRAMILDYEAQAETDRRMGDLFGRKG